MTTNRKLRPVDKDPVEVLHAEGPRASVMTVTPAMATEWITKNRSKNRKVSEATVLKYAEDMRSGRWVLNGETIIMDKAGNIIQGQHRLLACIEASDAYLEAVRATGPLRRLFAGGAIFAFYWLHLGKIDDSDRDFFFARLNDGLGLLEGDPVYGLRQAFLNARSRNRQMARAWMGGMLVKAWNKYRNHERIKLMMFSATEDYPTPI